MTEIDTQATPAPLQVRVKEGWKLVPVEPDDAMIEAGQDALDEKNSWGGRAYASDVWQAMINAAEALDLSTPPQIAALEAEIVKLRGERDDAWKAARAARWVVQATHKRAVRHENCDVIGCNICDGGLFVCADCGAAEIEAEQRTCSGAEAEVARLTEALDGAREEFDRISCQGVTEAQSIADALGWARAFANRGSATLAALKESTNGAR